MVRNAADAIIPDTIALCSSHVVRATVRVSAVAKYDHTPPPDSPLLRNASPGQQSS